VHLQRRTVYGRPARSAAPSPAHGNVKNHKMITPIVAAAMH
jgi:hypothetical protein